MKFSMVDGQRLEAQPELAGLCPACGQATIARCGEVNVWHWAHKGRRTCDPWWENETEWHRSWKAQFPDDWQEVVHRAESGEKHIADVKTDHGWVIEFQHSYIRPDERRSRNTFYSRLIWVVNGTRRKRDAAQFRSALNGGGYDGSQARIRIPFATECTILREWAGGDSPVFVDFGEGPTLWWILQATPNGCVDVAPFARSDLIQILRDGESEKARDFEDFVDSLRGQSSGPESRMATRHAIAAGGATTAAAPQHPMYMRRRSRRL